ncbi:diguanylate cyclase [Alteromonas pelagimontana]|uniref:Diguanylate cyclase n=1 Tax=Alteromonas pelagimontana TaxID=1858656 RepID=A0A6M4MDJ4_9ALTE|nr:diguanylate cyclase [Alteromonas pelagimontana]
MCDSDVVARLGGDKFVVLFLNTSKSIAEEVIKRLMSKVSSINQKNVYNNKIEFFVGVIGFNAGAHNNVSELLKEADALMYSTKREKQRSNKKA